jgi:hypothetical protein
MAITHSVYAEEKPPAKKPAVTKTAEKKQSLEIHKIKKKSNADKPTDASKLPKPKVKRLDVLAAEKAKK